MKNADLLGKIYENIGKPGALLRTAKQLAPLVEERLRLIDRTALRRHVQRATDLEQRIARLEQAAASLVALVDHLSSPILVTDRNAVLRHANAAGADALRKADRLVVRNGHLEPRNVRQVQQFTKLLTSAIAEDFGRGDHRLNNSMRFIDSSGHSSVLFVFPLRGATNTVDVVDAVLFLTNPNSKSVCIDKRLQSAFNLTPAETRLAGYLIHGNSLAEIGKELCLSRETLKSQLTSLFGKTGTRRQSEVVALLLSCITVSIA